MGCGGCVGVMAVVGESWQLCVSWWLCGGHGGCVWVMAVVCGSWRLCGGHGVWVMAVVCVSHGV